MDIYAKPGSKVKFTGRGGLASDRLFASTYLRIGQEYTVESVNAGNWSSAVILKEIPGKSFNTVMFEDC